MKTPTSFRFGFVSFVLILMVSFGLNGILGISGFEKTYRESLVSQFSIQGETLKGRIEAALNLGKRLHLLDDQIDDFFFESMRLSSGIDHFYVADSSGDILYSTRTVLNQRTIPFQIPQWTDMDSGDNRPIVETIKFLDSDYICIPLYSEDTFYEGMLLIEFSEESVSSNIMKIAEKIIRYGIIFLALTMLTYLILFSIFGKYPKAKVLITILLLLGSQIAFSVQNYSLYNDSISNIFGKNMSVQAKSLAEDFQKVMDYSVPIDNLGGADEYLAGRIQGNPQCAEAYITDINLNVLYETSQENRNGEQTLSRQDTDLTILPISSIHGNGYMVLRVNRELINTILRDMAMDSGTIILVALIFAFILQDLLVLLSSGSLIRKPGAFLAVNEPDKALGIIKISTFLFMFAAFETLSFIPLLIQDIYEQSPFILGSLDKKTIISLPVGSYMLGIMISMFVTMFFLKSFSIRRRYILMTLFFIAGSILTIQSGTFGFLIIARLIAGFGFGGVLLSTSSLVISYTTEKTRSQGFGTNAAAFAAASICSIPIGGIVVNKYGYEAGIWVSIIFAVMFLAFSLICIAGSKKSHEAKLEENAQEDKQIEGKTEKEKNLSLRSFFKILFSRHILVYILCVNIPFQLIYVGLFQFLLPLYMNDTLALSQGNIGRILSIFSIVSLGAAWVSKLSDRVKKDNLLIAFGAFCVGIMLILFKLYPEGGLLIFFGVMIGMGIDNVFIDAIEEVYVASGKVHNVTEENLLQSYKTIEKIISVIIPTVTGLIIYRFGFDWSMLYIGLWSVAGAIAFVLLGKNGRWETKKNV